MFTDFGAETHNGVPLLLAHRDIVEAEGRKVLDEGVVTREFFSREVRTELQPLRQRIVDLAADVVAVLPDRCRVGSHEQG